MTVTKRNALPPKAEQIIDEVSQQWYLMSRTNQVVLSTCKAMKLPAALRAVYTLGGTEQARLEQIYRAGIEFEQSLRRLIKSLEKLYDCEDKLGQNLSEALQQHQVNCFGDEYRVLLKQEQGGSPFSVTLMDFSESIKSNGDMMHKQIREITEGYVNACVYEATLIGTRGGNHVKSVDERQSITPEEEYVSKVAKTGGVLNSVMGAVGLLTLGANPVSLTCLIGGAILTAYGDDIAKPLVKACDKVCDKAAKAIKKGKHQ